MNFYVAPKEKELITYQEDLVKLQNKIDSFENKKDIKIGNEKVQCDQCNHTYKFKNQIEAHIESQHGGKEKIKINIQGIFAMYVASRLMNYLI